MSRWVYDENSPGGQIDLDADPNAATRWANIPGGTGSWDSIKSLFYNVARPQDVPHDALAKAGFVINPDGTLTRAQIRDAGIAAQQDAEAGFMNGGWIPGVIGGALAGGLTGMIPGTTAFGAGGAAGLAGDAFLPGALQGTNGLAGLAGNGVATVGSAVGDAYLPGALGSTGTGYTGAGSLEVLGGAGGGVGGGSGGGTGLADPYTSPQIPDIYETAPNIGGNTGGSGFNMDYFKNTPSSTIAQKLVQAGIDPAQAATLAQQATSGGTAASATQSALSKLLGIDSSTGQALGAVGTTLAGLYGSSQLKDIYNQQRQDRMPAMTAYNNALANPDSWYQSAPAQGATEAVLRKLSINGNPAGNPGDLSKAAAYNLGGYTNYLNSLGHTAFGGEATQAQLGSNAATSGANSIIGGINAATTPTSDWATLLKQFGGGGFKLSDLYRGKADVT